MGRQGGKHRGGRKWSRKRKAEEKSAKSDKPRDGGAGRGGEGGYNTIRGSNAKFEAYYSLVGLHDDRYDAASGAFVPCANDEEKHAERDLFMSTLGGILPASFRVDRSLDPTMRETLLEELREFVGKEVELEIELPRRSAAFGGMKNILEKGGGGEKDAEAQGEGDEQKEGSSGDKAVDGDNNGSDEGDKDGAGKTPAAHDPPVVVKRTIPPAKPIPFIEADGTVLGYQLSVDRRTIRRNKSLEPLHDWLKIQTDCGHVTRQETVSMIPPVVLDVREGMSVLDMCAAPGSKTCQLLEVAGGLDGGGGSGEGGSGGKGGGGGSGGGAAEPSGYVVANDADPKRAYMLVNQLRRMNSPAAFVTSCDGQYFPILDEKSARGTDAEGTFDRVLCDVPCSGDGTIRKNPGIWLRWNHLGSLALHPLQLSIALRGARLTRVGGYMAYSTCSMNPMENESVVAELLRVGDGSLVLEDPRGRMEGLVARPGWSTWRVLRESKNRTRRSIKDRRKKNNAKMQEKRKEWEEKRLRGECPPSKEPTRDVAANGEEGEAEKEEPLVPSPYDTIPYVPPATWDEASLSERTTSLGFAEYKSYEDVEPDWRRRVRASCFPPTAEEAEKFQMHKCLRCLPQDMDTGGFFVALLKKVKPLSSKATDRMAALVKESRGGVEVDAHLNMNGDHEQPSAGSSCPTGTEPDAAKDKKDVENSSGNDRADPTKDLKEEEEPIRKAPAGKVGMYHHHKKKTDLGKEDFIPCDPSVWPALVEEYGLTPDLPKDQFMVRASGDAKVLYFITKSIKDLIDRGIQDRVTVINSGLKAFERCSLQDKKVDYRMAQEGIQYVVPYMTRRILTANMDDFHTCVRTGFITFDQFSEPFRKGLEELEPGSLIVKLKGYEDDVSKKMYLSMWRRRDSVNCFVAKVEMDAILSKMRALGHVPKAKEETSASVESSAEVAKDKSS